MSSIDSRLRCHYHCRHSFFLLSLVEKRIEVNLAEYTTSKYVTRERSLARQASFQLLMPWRRWRWLWRLCSCCGLASAAMVAAAQLLWQVQESAA